jgi:zinc/manganese transport system permease protein
VVSVGNNGLGLLAVCTAGVIAVLAFVYRPLLFASSDPEVAVARGVPVRALSIVFAVLLGITAAFGVQIVGALLVLALLITPAAAAAQLTANPIRATVLAVVFAEVAAVGGILLSLAPGVPVSTFVTTISFLIYLACRLLGASDSRTFLVREHQDSLRVGGSECRIRNAEEGRSIEVAPHGGLMAAAFSRSGLLSYARGIAPPNDW